ncbi:MAG TPA: ABC transporter permease [Vicinamibacterales bacterium]|nr:ABC transporter permease [Vicinamibacterales bacterium]
MKQSLRSWLWRVPLDQEVDDEIAFHIEMRTRELVERGVDPTTAREIVLARLGDLSRLKRTCVDLGRQRDREMRITQWCEEFRDDVLCALRQMQASPAFTMVAALTLALGIGANSAIFALADATFLRPLPFTQPQDRLVMIWERYPNGFLSPVTPLDFNDWADQNRTFDAMAALSGALVTLNAPDSAPEQISAQAVTARFFDVLGVTPIAGRTFLPSDAATPNVVVLNEGLWRRRFGADRTIVGRSIVIGGRATTVIGIVPNEFQVLPALNSTNTPTGLWLFNEPAREGVSMRRSHILRVIGRIKPGLSFDAAQRDMTAIGSRNAELFPDTNKGHDPTLQPMREALIGSEMRLTSMLLLGVVGFVLLMCCANVANLLLARTSARTRELAVRAALGATRRRIFAQLLTESLVLSTLGGVLSLAVGWAILRSAPSLVPPGVLPGAVALSFDARVIAFCAVTAFAVGLVFGLAPAWQSIGCSMMQTIARDSRTTTRGGTFRHALVVAEVAAAVLVLSGAVLLLRTLIALQHMDAGYRAQAVLTMLVTLPMPGPGGLSRYATPESLKRFYDAIEEEVSREPGVRRVAIGSSLPLDGAWFGQAFDIDGDQPKPPAARDTAVYQMVSPSYFETLDIPIVKGRAFADTDISDGMQVCIVSEAFVRRYLGGRDPIGMRLAVPRILFAGNPALAAMAPPVREIVGVARQVKVAPTEPDPVPQLYVPVAQNAWYMATIIVRPSSGPAAALLPSVRAAIARVDEEQAVSRVRTIDVVAAEATARPRFRAVLVGTFAALALMLAMVGVFGMLAYSVQARMREFGVRIALGAGARDVARLVFGSAARLTAIGLAIGLIAAAVLTRWISTLVYPIAPLDPVTFAAVPLVLIITAAIAVAAPAWRAARADPVEAFRSE